MFLSRFVLDQVHGIEEQTAMACPFWLRSRRGIVGPMELRQLAAFVAVADELHFGRAAERLGVVQPAVSQLVRRLERELGVVLFERSSHHVALTGAGAELVPAARRALSARDELVAAAPALVRGEQGELRIGTSEGLGSTLNLLVARFADKRPNAGIRLEAIHTPAKLRDVRDGDLDVAFVRAPLETAGLRVVELWREPLVAVLPERERVAAREAIRLADLSSLPLMLAPRSANPGMHDQLLALCRSSGLEPRLGPRLESLQEALATISTGAAWTVLAATNAPRRAPGVAVRAIAEPEAISGVALAWRVSAPSPLTRTFVDLAIHARDQGELDPNNDLWR
jgi:DNA-binding transcriptional LysR family regulator